jgi:hypothetical protein
MVLRRRRAMTPLWDVAQTHRMAGTTPTTSEARRQTGDRLPFGATLGLSESSAFLLDDPAMRPETLRHGRSELRVVRAHRSPERARCRWFCPSCADLNLTEFERSYENYGRIYYPGRNEDHDDADDHASSQRSCPRCGARVDRLISVTGRVARVTFGECGVPACRCSGWVCARGWTDERRTSRRRSRLRPVHSAMRRRAAGVSRRATPSCSRASAHPSHRLPLDASARLSSRSRRA